MSEELLSKFNQPEKVRLRRKNLLFGFAVTLCGYAFFTLQHFFFKDNEIVRLVSYFLVGVIGVIDLMMSIGLAFFINITENSSSFPADRDQQYIKNMICGMLDSYYPHGTMGRLVEILFLCLVVVPFYLVIALVLQNIGLLMVLFWSRLNMVVYANLQEYYYSLVIAKCKATPTPSE